MKAAVFEDLNKMAVKEMPAPEVDDESVLVRVRTCAVCGSDLRIFRHGNSRVKPPQIIGHEIAGEVVEVGRNVTRFKVGDRVATGADVPCGECGDCLSGHGNNCRINYAMGYQFAGGFAEYVLLNRIMMHHGPVHEIPKELDFDGAALAEPLACCINGLELSRIELGDTVVIIGAGPIGCMLTELANRMGAGRVVLADRDGGRMAGAGKFGARHCIDSSKEDLVSRVMEITGGEGAAVAITACPSVDAQAEAFRLVKNRGRINFFGGLPKGAPMLQLDTNAVHYKEISVHGTHGSVPRQHGIALRLMAGGAIDPHRYISHHFSLDRILDAFAAVENREGLKAVINP